jgi:hypothetical protein
MILSRAGRAHDFNGQIKADRDSVHVISFYTIVIFDFSCKPVGRWTIDEEIRESDPFRDFETAQTSALSFCSSDWTTIDIC